MEIHYTVNKNALILISLMKQYGIKKVIASPGTVNVPFVAIFLQGTLIFLKNTHC